jgi:CheY-like chemotaxis protein
MAILVADDNEDSLALLDCLLRAHGQVPMLARDGAEAVLIALERRPEAILLDLSMPTFDSFEVARAIRRTDLDRTRIVAVTASAMAGDRERIAAAGFDGYISKPIDPETFIAELERLVPGVTFASTAGSAR